MEAVPLKGTIPVLIVFDPSGEERGRLVGLKETEVIVAFLDRVKQLASAQTR